MRTRASLAAVSIAIVAALAWFTAAEPKPAPLTHWSKIGDGVYRTKTMPYGYALLDGEKALLIDATVPPNEVDELGAKSIDAVLLTHHHRDAVEHAARYRKNGVAVRASKESAEWLKPESVAKYWKESIPLRTSRTAYFVVPEGIDGIDYTIEDGKPFTFGKWRIAPVATPGHSRDHFAYLATTASAKYLFCGDAFSTPGKMWTPYTTDWDHWTDAGLKPTAASLRTMAKLNVTCLCPEHGSVIEQEIAKTLETTAKAVDEAAFMKSFERFSKERIGNAPKYDFLVPKEQIASAGEKPWAHISDHLWITGNTYVLKSKTGNGIFVLDPWGQRSADQVEKLRKDEKLGPVEVAAFSHAHYDHFDGIYVLDGRDKCEVWALDLVSLPLVDPMSIRAPFLDARPIKFTKLLKDGDTATWGGYTFKFYHLPGQSWFTSGIETTIDGKHCLFTADNFFHQDQFSGTGGWMGLNRSSPAVYGGSARKVLEIAPERVLAEHGGPYLFDKEDYRRRVKWGEAAGKAADALSPSGDHLRDWTPHRLTVEPHLTKAKPGEEIRLKVTLSESGRHDPGLTATLQGRSFFVDQKLSFAAGGRQSSAVKIKLAPTLMPGRHVFAVQTSDLAGGEPVDAFFAVEVPSR